MKIFTTSSGALLTHSPLAALFSVLVLGAMSSPGAMAQSPSCKVLAAGSLRASLEQAAAAFERGHGVHVSLEFGPSGLLRERIVKGEHADVFASANMEHPQSLVRSGIACSTRPFATNRMCVLARPGIDLESNGLLDRMLDPALKLGTSTPGSDPAGDYAWKVFQRAQALRPDALEKLSRKALKLTGGAVGSDAPKGRTAYAVLLDRGDADLFLTYCTNAAEARSEAPHLRSADLPANLQVEATYGLAIMKDASACGEAFAQFLLGEKGQTILRRYGFFPPSAG